MNPFTLGKNVLHLCLVQFGLAACMTASAAVSFSITPSSISNTYNGFITLQVNGLSSHETVVVQRYLDVNGNSVVDGSDWLILQFQITDAQGPSLVGGATNINIPFDSGTNSGPITTQLSPSMEGIAQRFVGQSLFVVSSPSNHFTAITNTFTVTAFNYPQSITGTVLNNGTPVPNALVLVSPYRGPGHSLNPMGGVVANTAGVYTVKAAPGTYQLHGFKSDVLTAGAAPINLAASATVNTNLFILPASNHISGQLVDSADANTGLPGMLMAASANGTYGFGGSSSNGTFSLPVNAGQWRIGGDRGCFNFHGYVTYDASTNFTVSSDLSGIVLSYPKANALFYGRVRDGQGNAVAGVRLEGRNGIDGNGLYQGDATSDRNGNYAMGLIAPSNWDIGAELGINSIEFSNYVFSLAPFSYNNGGAGTDFIANMAVKQDFTALLGTNQISGFIRSNGITPLAGLAVEARADDINGTAYQTQTTSDASGFYVLNVPNGTWSLNLDCCTDCNDSGALPPSYVCPDSQTVSIAGHNTTVDFDAMSNVTPPGILAILANGGSIQISFIFAAGDTCEIQGSSTVVGPWTVIGSVVGGSSPYTFNSPMTAAQRYFRIHDVDTGLYSTNTVGYLNVSLGNSWNLIANPFLGVSQLPDLFPAPNDGSIVYKVGAGGLDCSFYDEFSFGWYDCATFDLSNMSLSPGEGAFFGGGQSGTQTFLGVIPEGTLTVELSAGISLCSSIVPQAGGISSDLGFPAEDGDIVYKFNPTQQAYSVYVYYADFAEWDPTEPVISVGEAFWLELPSAREWVRNFAVSEVGSAEYTVTNLPYTGGPSPFVPHSGSGTAPSITTQPQSRTNVAGSDATFSVSASGTAPLSYQWFFGSSPILGAVSSEVAILSVQPPNAGDYSVIVSNPYGSATSTVAVLTVDVCTPAPPGLVAWWRAENNAVDSVGTNDGTLRNGATFAPGEVGTGFSFDAATLSYVEIPYSPAFDINAQGTVQLWHKLGPTQPEFPCLISRGNNADNLNNFLILIQAGYYRFSLGNGGCPSCTTGIGDVAALLDDQWHHIAFTWDGTTTKAFVDGVLSSTQPQALTPVTVGTPPLLIASAAPSDARVHVNGRIDEVALFNRALTSSEVFDLYAAGSAGICPDGIPFIVSQPLWQTNLLGNNVQFAVTAGGTPPLSYQWRKGIVPLPGATNTTLTLSNLQARNAGDYTVMVSNPYGEVTSETATLQINAVFLDSQPVAGSASVTNSAQVEIATGYPDGAIFYTLDGSYPGIGQLYYGPFTLSNSAVLRAIGYSADYSLSAEVPAVNITVLHGPTIINQPQSQTRLSGQAAAFGVLAEGDALSYQWYLDGSPIPGATAPAFLMLLATPGTYSVVVSNPYGSVESEPATLTVFDPVAITTQPTSTNVPPNTPVTFSVAATGSPPLQYQWRLNGANLAGQTNDTLSIPNVQLTEGGTYTVVVLNEVGTLISDPALLTILVTGLQPADNFANRVPLNDMSGSVSGNSFLATKEAGEPNHAGKPGGKSVWYKWTAPTSGLAIFHTQGSSFDTVLAIYQGTDLTSLSPVAANDDGGGNLTSEVQFNAVSGTEYSIAIDGVGGTGGYLILSWALQAGGPAIPVVLVGPQDIAVVRGYNGTFSVIASGPNLAYEWQFDDSPIQGATNSTLIVSNVQLSAVGIYSVRVSSGAISIFSGAANLEMVSQPGSVTRDKLADASAALPGPGAPSLQTVHSPARLAFTPLSFGIPGSQDFANTHSATDLTDPAVCAVGGSSRWLIFRPATAGLLSLDTIGTAANLPTIIAAYRGGTVADIVPANLLGCDVNSAPDGHSLLRFQVQANTSYSVLLDATNGVTGLIHLNYCLGSAPVVTAQSIETSIPASLVREGGSLTLNGPVSTPAPAPSYQWYRDGFAISGATQVDYNLGTATANSAGVYSIVVSNCLGIASNVIARVKVEVPLTLSFLASQTAGKLDFHITGSASQPFMIQATSNLLNWIPLFTNPTPFTPINFADPVSGTRSNRFYRAAPWQP